MITIYHNPRCGKSRDCLAFLEQSGKEYEIVNYLETAPTYEELEAILKKLHLKPIELVRQKEKVWIDNFKHKSMTDQAVIQAMVSHPILIERPIVIVGDKAVIARPLEKMNDII
jgi:arsenate reductase